MHSSVRALLYRLKKRITFSKFPGSKAYWEERYIAGRDSGSGSYNRLAIFKAEVVNHFVKENNIKKVIEFGSGDGNQLSLGEYPDYIGLDVSPTIIRLCKEKFSEDKTKSFFLYDSLCFVDNHNIFKADLTLSLDVVFHLTEDDVFHEYMKSLFGCSTHYVIVYSSNTDKPQRVHEKDRAFTKWVEQYAPGWKLIKMINNPYPFDPKDPDNTSKADFYFFERISL
ncbi:MAG: class I SAM-dependent methyltransferase [Bacteroidales bacterium]